MKSVEFIFGGFKQFGTTVQHPLQALVQLCQAVYSKLRCLEKWRKEILSTNRLLEQDQVGCGISKMVVSKKQAYSSRIYMLKGNFDTNYFELLMILSSPSSKSWWFWLFPLKLVYFWTKSRKKHGCFFHSICATELKFGTKNNVRTRKSTLKTLIFADYWKS